MRGKGHPQEIAVHLLLVLILPLAIITIADAGITWLGLDFAWQDAVVLFGNELAQCEGYIESQEYKKGARLRGERLFLCLFQNHRMPRAVCRLSLNEFAIA